MVVDAGSSDRAGTAPDALSGAAAGALSGAAAGAGGSSNRIRGKENRTRLGTPCDLNLSHVSAGWQREVMDNTTENPEIRQHYDDDSESRFNPLPGECVVCFVHRQLGEFGCDDTHRFAERFREQTAPRATALIPRLRGMGAEHCDCQLFREVFTFAPRPLLARGIFAANIGGRLDADELTDIGVFADPRGDGRGIGYSHVKTGRTVDQFVWSDRRAYIDTAGYDDGVGFPGMDGDAGYADIGGFAEDEYPFGRGRVDAPTPAAIYLCCQYVRRGSTQPCGNWQRGKRPPRWTTPTGPGWGAESWNPEPPGWYTEPPEEPGVRAPF